MPDSLEFDPVDLYRRGFVRPFGDNIRAHFAQGTITRSMGRAERLAPPTRRLSKLCPASSPANKRMVVAEFPQSISPDGAREQPFLSVHDQHVRLRVFDLDSEEAKAWTVLMQSSLGRNPRRTHTPLASEAIMAAR